MILIIVGAATVSVVDEDGYIARASFCFFSLSVLYFCRFSLSFLSVHLFCLFAGITGVACTQTYYLETLRRTLGVLDPTSL